MRNAHAQCERRATLFDHALHRALEQVAFRQAGQIVVKGSLRQLAFPMPMAGDVDRRDDLKRSAVHGNAVDAIVEGRRSARGALLRRFLRMARFRSFVQVTPSFCPVIDDALENARMQYCGRQGR